MAYMRYTLFLYNIHHIPYTIIYYILYDMFHLPNTIDYIHLYSIVYELVAFILEHGADVGAKAWSLNCPVQLLFGSPLQCRGPSLGPLKGGQSLGLLQRSLKLIYGTFRIDMIQV